MEILKAGHFWISLPEVKYSSWLSTLTAFTSPTMYPNFWLTFLYLFLWDQQQNRFLFSMSSFSGSLPKSVFLSDASLSKNKYTGSGTYETSNTTLAMSLKLNYLGIDWKSKDVNLFSIFSLKKLHKNYLSNDSSLKTFYQALTFETFHV